MVKCLQSMRGANSACDTRCNIWTMVDQRFAGSNPPRGISLHLTLANHRQLRCRDNIIRALFIPDMENCDKGEALLTFLDDSCCADQSGSKPIRHHVDIARSLKLQTDVDSQGSVRLIDPSILGFCLIRMHLNLSDNSLANIIVRDDSLVGRANGSCRITFPPSYASFFSGSAALKLNGFPRDLPDAVPELLAKLQSSSRYYWGILFPHQLDQTNLFYALRPHAGLSGRVSDPTKILNILLALSRQAPEFSVLSLVDVNNLQVLRDGAVYWSRT